MAADPQAVRIRDLQDDEVSVACALVTDVFQREVAPLYSEEGVAHFLRYAGALAMAQRRQTNHFQRVAVSGAPERLVGVIEVRGYSHVSLLFVDPSVQGRGVARALVEEALDVSRRALPGLPRLTVNASPNAVAAYQRLGFEPVDEQRVVNGIAFVPMERPLG